MVLRIDVLRVMIPSLGGAGGMLMREYERPWEAVELVMLLRMEVLRVMMPSLGVDLCWGNCCCACGCSCC